MNWLKKLLGFKAECDHQWVYVDSKYMLMVFCRKCQKRLDPRFDNLPENVQCLNAVVETEKEKK